MSKEKERPALPKNMLFSWKAERFENIERHPKWHVIVFLVLLGTLAYGLFADNFLLSIISILAGFLIYVFDRKDPEVYTFGILPEGIFAQDHLYQYSTLENFWIFYEPGGRKELSLKSTRFFLPYIHIPLGTADPAKIRKTLVKFLPEEEHEESLIDQFEKFL